MSWSHMNENRITASGKRETKQTIISLIYKKDSRSGRRTRCAVGQLETDVQIARHNSNCLTF